MLDTLANVKTSLLISGTTDDAVLTRLMDAADSYITDFTSRAFVGGTFTETHPAGHTLIFLRNWPTVSITSLKVDSARQFGSETAWEANRYYLHKERGVVESLVGPFLWPRRHNDWPGAVQVVYATASEEVPPAVKEAFVQLIGHWYRFAKTAADQDYQMLATRIDNTGQKDWPWSLAVGEPLPLVVQQLLQPYRVPAA